MLIDRIIRRKWIQTFFFQVIHAVILILLHSHHPNWSHNCPCRCGQSYHISRRCALSLALLLLNHKIESLTLSTRSTLLANWIASAIQLPPCQAIFKLSDEHAQLPRNLDVRRSRKISRRGREVHRRDQCGWRKRSYFSRRGEYVHT